MRFLTFCWYLFTILGMCYNTSMVIWMFIWPHGFNGTEYYLARMIQNAKDSDSALANWIETNITTTTGTKTVAYGKIITGLMYAAAACHAFILWLECVKYFTLRRPCAWWTTNTIEMLMQLFVGALHLIIACYGIKWFGIWCAFAFFSFLCLMFSYCFPWGQMRCHARQMYAPEPYMVYPETQVQQEVVDRGVVGERVIAE